MNIANMSRVNHDYISVLDKSNVFLSLSDINPQVEMQH